MSTNDGNWKNFCDLALASALVAATCWQGTLLHSANEDNRESSGIAKKAAMAADKAATAAESNAETASKLLDTQKQQLAESARLANFTHDLAMLQEKQIIALYRPIITTELAKNGQSDRTLSILVKNIGNPIAYQLKLAYLQSPGGRFNDIEHKGTLDGPNELLQGPGFVFPIPLRLEDWINRPAGGGVSITGSITFKDAADNLKSKGFCFKIVKSVPPNYPAVYSEC